MRRLKTTRAQRAHITSPRPLHCREEARWRRLASDNISYQAVSRNVKGSRQLIVDPHNIRNLTTSTGSSHVWSISDRHNDRQTTPPWQNKTNYYYQLWWMECFVVVVTKNEVREEITQAVSEEECESRRTGTKTYRAPEGRPRWAEPVDLVLPIISPRYGGVEVVGDLAICHSVSADCLATRTSDANTVEIVTDPPIHESDSAEYVTICPNETNYVISNVLTNSPINVIHHSTTADYETANAAEAIYSSVQHVVIDLPSHHSEAADYALANSDETFFVPDFDPQIQKFQSAASEVETIAVPHIAFDPRPTHVEHHIDTPRPPATTDEDRLNEDPRTIRHAYTYNIKAADPLSDCKTTGMPTTDRRRTKSSIYPNISGSTRDYSYDPGQRMGKNRVGSTRRVSLKDSDINRKKWSSERAKVDNDGRIKVNRKLCDTGNTHNRNLMTSSVTTVVTPRPCSGHNVRSSASLGTQQVITSSKPEPEIQRRLAAAQRRVGS